MNKRMSVQMLGLLFAGLIIAGCQTAAKKVEPTPTPTPQPAAESTPTPPPPEEHKAAVNGPVDDNGNPVGNTVYFEYDSAAISADGQKLVGYHAKYLSSNDGQKVLVEGNCDERGTREYNLALGERRSAAVKEALVAGGVKGGQLETTSWGEEKPVDPGHDESAWSKNRRAELTYRH